MKNECYVCKVRAADCSLMTEEHIFPQLIGGRKTSRILCQIHNSYAGEKIDPGLLGPFQPFRVHLRLVPGSKSKPKKWDSVSFKMPSTGEEFLLNSLGDAFLAKPTVVKTKLDDGKFQIRIKASTNEEVKLLLKQLKGKYPKLSSEDFKPENFPADNSTEYMTSIIMTGEPLKRAIAKVAIGFAASLGVETEPMSEIIGYCFENKEGQYVSHLHDFITDRLKNNSFNHTIVLHGSSSTNLLVCFVEFFACAPFIVLLSGAYAGPDVNYSYSMDPTNHLDQTASAKINLTKENFQELFKHDDLVPSGFIDCYRHGTAAAHFRQKQNREISDVVDEAIQHLKLDPKTLSAKDLMLISSYVVEKYFMPKLLSRRRRNS